MAEYDLLKRAEVIAIGDELTTGVRLDTNTQWLSQQLGGIGLLVAFHTTVGDDLKDITQAFSFACERADFVVATGGLGPTADDLTRFAIAAMVDVELSLDESVLQHIEGMYQTRGREMPPNNVVQAQFPVGTQVIPNPEGTAPGLDFLNTQTETRIFCLPGVPVEMKQMWAATVEPAIQEQVQDFSTLYHHTVHCFGTGESQMETMLPDLIRRGRDPQVGITASSATISLRISTRAESLEACRSKIQPTLETIHECLGDLVFGENGQTLAGVVTRLLQACGERIVVFEDGTNGKVVEDLVSVAASQGGRKVVAAHDTGEVSASASEFAETFRQQYDVDYALVVGPINREPELVSAGESYYELALAFDGGVATRQVRFSGHSGWREARAVKEVLNFVRLALLKPDESRSCNDESSACD